MNFHAWLKLRCFRFWSSWTSCRSGSGAVKCVSGSVRIFKGFTALTRFSQRRLCVHHLLVQCATDWLQNQDQILTPYLISSKRRGGGGGSGIRMRSVLWTFNDRVMLMSQQRLIILISWDHRPGVQTSTLLPFWGPDLGSDNKYGLWLNQLNLHFYYTRLFF